MSKIFRLYKEGTSTYEDWNSSPAFPYNSTNRDTIEDPDGASARTQITSIPSPFARIDLIKNAFKEVVKPDRKTKKVNLDGNTIFHKMVSDTLDVAEIFFNIDKNQDKIEIIKWDPAKMLEELNTSGAVGHRYLADALKKYMGSDAATYNFNELRNIYLLNYKGGPEEINIIGATSPATLFFSNANDLSYVNDIYFGNDKPFDNDFQPLYNRDTEFVKYLFALRKNIENFADLFPEVNDYLSATYTAITDLDLKNKLNAMTKTALDDYDTITVADVSQNDLVEVLGHNLGKKTKQPINTDSDFVIDSAISADHPLVLPIESGNRYSELRYVTDKWGRDKKAPVKNPESDLAKRELPQEGSLHPYLTISDFLEDTLVRVPHTLNTAHYFDGNMRIDKPELGFLLPLKPLFFKYFTTERLRGPMADGKPMFEMRLLAGDSVSVTLRVPIKGAGNITYIEYTRLYYNNSPADIKNNKGNIGEMKFTGFIMPQVRFNNPGDAIYNVSCIQASSGKSGFEFYKGTEKVIPDAKECRNDGGQFLIKADNYLLKGKDFDFVRVTNQHGYAGVLVPLFREQRSLEKFEFAVDLGTSNTHIEYRQGGGQPRVFGFTQEDTQLCEMFTAAKNEYGYYEDLIEEKELMEKDFLPMEIGTEDYSFPTRTVLSCAKTLDFTNQVYPFTLVNLPFTYDKRADLPYNNLRHNIKWGKREEHEVMKAYVGCLMLMMRNKVLLNNGDLKATKITWFYPISMAPKRLNKLRETWNEAYHEYFGDGVTESLTESEAPIRHFFKTNSKSTTLVNVDIGGGTTDIAFAKDMKVLHVTSFRYASNALFENPFAESDPSNGIVGRYKGEILKLLQEKPELSELVRVFNSTNNQSPSNMASFLFGLKDNTIPKKAGINSKTIDFNYLLQEDEDFKIVFIVFYTSIIYHIAQITKALGLEEPRHISFSGNGSKVIRVITTDLKVLSKYTKLIFEKVLGRPYGKDDLELLGLGKDSNPKESTCKGGLEKAESEDLSGRTIVFKSDCTGVVKPEDTYDKIDEGYKRKTVEAVEEFFRFVFDDMNKAFNFDNYFGVKASSMKTARQVAFKDLYTYLDKGIAQRREETEAEDTIEETFFFYPIKGVLQSMSQEIHDNIAGK